METDGVEIKEIIKKIIKERIIICNLFVQLR
jgi:hypothetical protein